MKAIRVSLDAEAVKQKSRRIAMNLFALDEFQRSLHIMFYLALEKEVQTDEMIVRALAMGKKVYVPFVDKEKR
ncbi:MAG: 5-formyltetrahydrofolate cyclo-ligase, partial [Deltaproteobacteria bacterium]|nr:5-formyltetrahydrofolate cyclo-ligase [Deltaproteobacteria bacterium]